VTILCDVTSPRAYVYKLKGCLKELHACEIHTNITTVVQKLIIVIIYSFLCQLFLCRYLISNFRGFASETGKSEIDDGFTRYPKLVSVS